MVKNLVYAVLSGLLLSTGTGVWAEENPQQPSTVLPGKPDEHGRQPLLGELFSSNAAGIAFRTPAGCVEVSKPAIPDLIAEFVNNEKKVVFKALTMELKEDRKLEDSKVAGKLHIGLITEVAEAFQKQNPVAEQLRKEVIRLAGGYQAGVVAFRYPMGTTRRLMQQAYIPVSDRYYYTLTLSSLGNKPVEGEVDPQEKMAADTFTEILSSVQLIDRSEIAKDQQVRLKRAKEVLEKLHLPNKMNKVIVPERWMRLTRDGKDIGYSYIVEERTKEDGHDGIMISIRSRTTPATDMKVDVVSRMFVSDGWMHESWSHMMTAQTGKKTEETSELGLADYQEKFKVTDTTRDLLANPDPAKTTDPEVTDVSQWKLQVRTKFGAMVGQPFERMLPSAYLPQAVLHLLPRMLPKIDPQTYMFLTYVSDKHQVMTRYIDVKPLKDVTLDGVKVRAYPVEDRVGLEGPPTTYYITVDGKNLGSETTYTAGGKKTTIRVTPSDEATLMKLWQNANLQKPNTGDVPKIPQGR